MEYKSVKQHAVTAQAKCTPCGACAGPFGGSLREVVGYTSTQLVRGEDNAAVYERLAGASLWEPRRHTAHGRDGRCHSAGLSG